MTIRYSEVVKKPGTEFQYTPRHIKELYDCQSTIDPFLKYVKIIHPDKGRIRFKPRQFQQDILTAIKTNRFVIALCSRQAGKTTIISVYALWYAIFNTDKNIGIVSNKQSSAVDILARIKTMYEELPSWLKPGIVEYSKLSIKFDNGTSIFVSATSPDAFRGRFLNLLISDELAFIRKGIAEEFWAANFPTISASEDAKIVIISTPNGPFNLFHRLYVGAEKGFNTFKHLKYDWRCVPGRNAKWAEEQLKNLGKVKFQQEQEVSFIGSINTVVDKDILEKLYFGMKDPIKKEMSDLLSIYEKPIAGQIYVIGTDTSKGTGEHYSSLQVLKIVSYKTLEYQQVAVFFDNRTNVYKLADILNKLSIYYNNAYMMVENNAEGAAVVDRIWWEYENEHLVCTGAKRDQLGIRATKSTKPKAVVHMKKLLEDGKLHLYDRETIDELTSFIEEGNNIFRGKDMPDDAVAALYWACYISEMDLFEEGRELAPEKLETKEDDEVWGIVSDMTGDEDWSWLSDPGTKLIG